MNSLWHNAYWQSLPYMKPENTETVGGPPIMSIITSDLGGGPFDPHVSSTHDF